MAGIFPEPIHGGEPPSAANRGRTPVTPPLNTSVLYYSSSCGSKVAPETLNAILSEFVCAIDVLDRAYDSGSLCNLSLAIRQKLITVFSARVGPVGPAGPPGICPPCP